MHVLMKSHTKGIELLNDNEIGCKSNNGAYTGENLYFDSLRMQKYEKYPYSRLVDTKLMSA